MNSHTQAVHELDWKAGVLLFSGLENPTWALSPPEAQSIIDIWNTLEPCETRSTPPHPQLGYSGSFLSNSNGDIWLASRHSVAWSGPISKETRSDPERKFERAILALAPEDVPIPDLDI